MRQTTPGAPSSTDHPAGPAPSDVNGPFPGGPPAAVPKGDDMAVAERARAPILLGTPPRTTPSATLTGDLPDLQGQQSQYALIQPIGRGGMSTVYLAYQPAMQRNVAIKVLPPQLTRDPHTAARFRQEAEVAARLEHQNVLPIYDVGEAREFKYIVMRYVPTGSLRHRLDTGSLTPASAYKIIVQVARALEYAHKQNVIHCDVKPSNVLIDLGEQAYLTDFGIARVLQQGQGPDALNAIGGTPGYMSPEQIRGDTVDSRADIYALGALVLEMLSGIAGRPTNEPTQTTASPARAAPVPRAGLPEPILKVIRRAMAQSPTARYQTVAEFSTALGDAFQLAPKSWLETGQSNALFPPSGLADVLSTEPTELLLRDVTEAFAGPAAPPVPRPPPPTAPPPFLPAISIPDSMPRNSSAAVPVQAKLPALSIPPASSEPAGRLLAKRRQTQRNWIDRLLWQLFGEK